MPRLHLLAVALLLGVPLGSGCWAFAPPFSGPRSMGASNGGYLLEGASLPDRGDGFVRARPGESTRFGLPRLNGLLARSASEVRRAFPGGAPLRIGDLSGPRGGRHPRHGSHRSGRDVDVLFYVVDPTGQPTAGRGWLAYNRFGYAIDRISESARPNGDLFFFDTPRNWHLVRTLLLDEDAGVQWLFVSRGVKARLLRYAMIHEQDRRVLSRAATVLHQPMRASPHDDHFHIRILCDRRARAAGCRNRGPIWPWLRDDWDKVSDLARASLDDDNLVRELLEPIEATVNE